MRRAVEAEVQAGTTGATRRRMLEQEVRRHTLLARWHCRHGAAMRYRGTGSYFTLRLVAARAAWMHGVRFSLELEMTASVVSYDCHAAAAAVAVPAAAASFCMCHRLEHGVRYHARCQLAGDGLRPRWWLMVSISGSKRVSCGGNERRGTGTVNQAPGGLAGWLAGRHCCLAGETVLTWCSHQRGSRRR